MMVSTTSEGKTSKKRKSIQLNLSARVKSAQNLPPIYNNSIYIVRKIQCSPPSDKLVDVIS